MKFAAIMLLAMSGSCNKPPVNPVPSTPDSGPPAVDGGIPDSGIATGGSSSIDAGVSTGGLFGTGGSSAVCEEVEVPDTALPAELTKKATRHKLGKRIHRKAGRAPGTVIAATPKCSKLNKPPSWTPLNQIDGSCTGNASCKGIPGHDNENDALITYQGGTCIDNNCTVCTCKDCPQAYCPDTHANDTGSQGASVSQFLVNKGWINSYTTADTIPQLLTCIAQGKKAVIGIDWRTSMWNTNSKGKLVVDLTTKFEGGHELFTMEFIAETNEIVVENSWGPWGWCFKKYMNASTPIDGTGCGFARIAVADLPKLNYDADCLQ